MTDNWSLTTGHCFWKTEGVFLDGSKAANLRVTGCVRFVSRYLATKQQHERPTVTTFRIAARRH